jgi:hypothetical protein
MYAATVIGLDVSTTCTGAALVRPDGSIDLYPIQFKKCKTFWEKVDHIKSELANLREKWGPVDAVCIEEPLKSFSLGASSAATITMLVRFNGIVSTFSREYWGHDPLYVMSQRARKIAGVHVVSQKQCGKPGKQQVQEHMIANDLSHIVWEKTRTGKLVPWVGDVIDAYVVAKYAALTT